MGIWHGCTGYNSSCSSASMSKLCAKITPFDFTACGGYAQGERQKSRQPQGPFVLSVATAKSKQRRVGCGSYAPILGRHASRVHLYTGFIGARSAPYHGFPLGPAG